MAFVVPAEIGHAAYAAPLVEALCASFGIVVIVAVREKIFPKLCEDAWILYAADHGKRSTGVRLVTVDRFQVGRDVPQGGRFVPLTDLRNVRGRLRRWLLPENVLKLYEAFERTASVRRLGSIAFVSIGYVSGANAFFHLRPSARRRAGIPERFVKPTVRRGGLLPATNALTRRQVNKWIADDDEVLLLHLDRRLHRLPAGVRRYLDSEAGLQAREAYKCRVREPWYSVPDVTVPDGFLSVMAGDRPQLVKNAARCVATNSVHVVNMRPGESFSEMQSGFVSTLTRLSCELEGHPLGGGLLKLEPREAQRLLIPSAAIAKETETASIMELAAMLEHGIATMRSWRGYARHDAITDPDGCNPAATNRTSWWNEEGVQSSPYLLG